MFNKWANFTSTTRTFSENSKMVIMLSVSYELSPFPSALFDSINVVRKADKPQLAHAISEHASDGIVDFVPETERHVLDVGSLLHRIPWKKGESYGTIAQSYADFTVRQYGAGTTVVFDGYEQGPSIKDNTHLRRGQSMYPVITFTAETEFSGKKEEFLSRSTNKQKLIWLVSDALRKMDCIDDCIVVNTSGDADVDIVKAAVETSRLHTTTLIGEDTMDWGWNHQDNLFVPIMSTMNAAPDILLKVIHCNCLNSCKTFRCSCRRNGLPGTSACVRLSNVTFVMLLVVGWLYTECAYWCLYTVSIGS